MDTKLQSMCDFFKFIFKWFKNLCRIILQRINAIVAYPLQGTKV